MATAPVTSKVHKPFNIHRDLTSSITFNDVITFNNNTDTVDIISAQIITVHLIRKIDLIENLASSR